MTCLLAAQVKVAAPPVAEKEEPKEKKEAGGGGGGHGHGHGHGAPPKKKEEKPKEARGLRAARLCRSSRTRITRVLHDVSSQEVVVPTTKVVMQKRIVYGVPTDAFKDVTIAVFDRSISSLHKLVQVERLVMDHLFWSYEPTISTIHETEEWVKDLRARIERCVTASTVCLSNARVHTTRLTVPPSPRAGAAQEVYRDV